MGKMAAGNDRGEGGEDRTEQASEGRDRRASQPVRTVEQSAAQCPLRPPAYLAAVWSYFSPSHPDLRTLRRTWWAGFCGLPLLWLLNWLNYRKASLEAGALTEIKILVRMSLALFCCSSISFLSWLIYFQTVTETLACPCDGLLGSDWRSVTLSRPRENA